MAYRYYSTLRPLMVGGIPFPKDPGESITTIVNFEEGRTYCKDIGRPAWGYIDHIREEAYNTGYSEAEAQRASTPAPGKTLPQLLEQLDAGECKGIKSATAYKIAEFAREQGYLE